MALVNMKDLLAEAKAGGWGVGAFNVANMESVLGVIAAAEAERSPVILQIAEIRLAASPLWAIGPLMLTAARHASVRVAVHFDHGMTRASIDEALALGFTSVMYDGSHLTLDENIRMTNEVIAHAAAYGASVEAEVGSVGRAEDGSERAAVCAEPADCIRFVAETGVDALAVAVGNAHGVYEKAPSLRFDVLEALAGRLETPLVLHGGTGLTDDDFRRMISLGMCKMNIGTAVFEATAGGSGPDLFSKIGNTVKDVAKVATRHMRIFGSAGREG